MLYVLELSVHCWTLEYCCGGSLTIFAKVPFKFITYQHSSHRSLENLRKQELYLRKHKNPQIACPPTAPHPTTQACAPRDARWFCDFVTDPLWDDIPSVSWLIDPSHRPPVSMPSKKRKTKHKPYHLMIDEKTDKETIWSMKTNVTILTHLMVVDDLWKTATQTKKWKHEKTNKNYQNIISWGRKWFRKCLVAIMNLPLWT